MELRITLTPDQEAFIQQGIAGGRFDSPEAIARLAMKRWEEYERQRAELLASIHLAEQSMARGEGTDISTPEALEACFERIKNEARRRYEARHHETNLTPA
jgi:Arc/MetJ-type ribon-helix-helix transcriptional regulator